MRERPLATTSASPAVDIEHPNRVAFPPPDRPPPLIGGCSNLTIFLDKALLRCGILPSKPLQR